MHLRKCRGICQPTCQWNHLQREKDERTGFCGQCLMCIVHHEGFFFNTASITMQWTCVFLPVSI